MSDGTTTTHERLTETRSWSEYDEAGNVTADHTTVRAICGTCYREQIGRHGHLEYVSADWPCPEVENARLRERVAALAIIANHVEDAWQDEGVSGDGFVFNLNWLLEVARGGELSPYLEDRARAALAQAGEGGAA